MNDMSKSSVARLISGVAFPGLCLAMLCLTIPSGCSRTADGRDRVQVSGTVRLNGELLPFGIIKFIPIADSNLPASAVDILNGKYESDRGLPKGKYRVEITGFKRPPEEAVSLDPSEASSGGNAQIIPKGFNVNSTLELTVDAATSHNDFDLKD